MTEYYLDHAASAPRRAEVSEAMAPWMQGVVGNPSGSHRAARMARRAVEDARDDVAALTGAKPGNVVFTAGGTESCTLAIAGRVRRHQREHATSRVLVSAIEHHAVLDAADMMARQLSSVSVDHVPVDGDGVVDLEVLGRFLQQPDVAIVSVMAANNETGVVQPVDAVGSLARSAGVISHSDMVAAAPWMDLSALGPELDMLSLCAHKIGGPVNAGALIMRTEQTLDALAPGGGQEKGRRGGTVDVAAAVGLATALRLVHDERAHSVAHTTELRDRLAAHLSGIDGCRVTAMSAQRLPGTVHVTFDDVASDEVLFLLDQAGIFASAAASCSSGAAVASHVLDAMGIAPTRAKGSLRLSMGPEFTADDIDAVATTISAVIARLRAESH